MSVFYTPNAQNVPLFKEKGEANISGALQLSSYSRGVDIQIAGAATNFLGIVLNYNHWGGSWETTGPFSNEQFIGKHKSDFGELGLGYYKPFKKQFVFETYSGFGIGNVINEYEEKQSSKLQYNRYYIQTAIGWYHKNIELVLSTRLCAIDYKKITVSTNIEEYDLDDIIYVENHPFSFMIEPAFTFRGGGRYVKFQSQIGLSFNLNNPDMRYDPININLGLIITIPAKKTQLNKDNLSS